LIVMSMVDGLGRLSIPWDP